MPDAFYLPLGSGRYRATEHTVGPWDPGSQHGGPPSALLVREIEVHHPRADAAIARVAVDLLGPVPATEVAVDTRVLRAGRRVELIAAELSAGGRIAMRATVWRIRTDASAPVVPPDAAAPPAPDTVAVASPGWSGGYLDAVEWRFVRGSFDQRGAATVWTRLRVPLLPGEAPSPAQRALAVADSGNGVSNALDITDWLFVNPDLTVHLHRPPVGEWIALDAATAVSAGVGLTTTRLYDGRGAVGAAAQSLFVGPR